MAQTYVCDLCGQVAADFMITVIHDGTVVAVGVECLLEWALPISEAFAAAQAREQGTPEPPSEPAPGPEADWERGYPQQARSGARGGRKSDATTVGEDTETSPAADVDG